MVHVKPAPIGCNPRSLHDETRFNELYGAIMRYSKENIEPNQEWIDEIYEIAQRYPDKFFGFIRDEHK